jgi:hypothetical protein
MSRLRCFIGHHRLLVSDRTFAGDHARIERMAGEKDMIDVWSCIQFDANPFSRRAGYTRWLGGVWSCLTFLLQSSRPRLSLPLSQLC